MISEGWRCETPEHKILEGIDTLLHSMNGQREDIDEEYLLHAILNLKTNNKESGLYALRGAV